MGKVGALIAGRAWWVAVFVLLLLASSITPGFADPLAESSPVQEEEKEWKGPLPPLPSSQEVDEAIENENSPLIEPVLTDPHAAEGVAHEGLGRNEALELLEGVFGAELKAPAGIFDELHVEKFLAPNVAVIGVGNQPETPALADEEVGGHYEGATLMESTLPLRAEAPSGKEEEVDLGLEYAEGKLRSTNPLVEVSVPEELGEGIGLPESGVHIELVGAPTERSPSIIDESVAGFPNVAEDTDFAIAPTPTGVETLTQLRSPQAPRSQTYELTLPGGATLDEEGGGAKVTREGKALLSIAPPTAIDATGGEVPVSLSASSDSLTLTVSPEESTKFPILVDPLFQTYEWYAKNTEEGIYYGEMEGWSEWSSEHIHPFGGVVGFHTDVGSTNLEPTVKYGARGLDVAAASGAVPGGEAFWRYTVPRYYSDPSQHEGREPESFITKLSVTDMDWRAQSEKLSPYAYMGLWGPVTGWNAGLYSHEGLSGHGVSNMAYVYTFENPLAVPDIKTAEIGLYSTETVSKAWTELYVGAATVELAEPTSTVPKFAELYGPTEWVNQTAVPINFKVEDAGLGVSSLTISGEQGSSPPSWKTAYSCTGVPGKPCPYTWKSYKNIEPALLPQGIDTLKVVAEDPIGHVSTGSKEGKPVDSHVQVAVDHTAPELALSGTMTEQTTLGTKRPTYTLKANTMDGTTEQPQSGVAKVVIEVDNKVEAKSEPGCSTKNCAIPLEWSLESGKYSAGQHTVKVIATDGVGLATAKTMTITLNPSPPSIALTGTMTEQAAMGLSRPRYKLKVSAFAEAGIEGPAPAPTPSSSLGTSGTGNGQFAHPGDVALDSKGNLWVVDENNNRVEEFNEKGEYVAKFGSLGSGNGQFSRPTSLAIDSKGNLWVTDAGNNRVEEFNEKGEYVAKFGSLGSGNGQFSGPEGIAIDPKGNIWVSDTYNARLQKFNEKGEFIKAIGTKGSATGQLFEPTGIDIGPGGNVWVADWFNNRVEAYNEAGEYVRQFGSEGTGNGQFRHPDALAIDTKGDVWVADQNNERVQEFNRSGEYVAKFGTAGSGGGQFNLGYPMGIAADPKGNLWVTDTGNNRVQKWLIPGYAPTYSSAFGTQGTASGQFQHPADVAVDAERNIYVLDQENNRVEKFNASGQFIKAFGTYGSGNGQLNGPSALAIDPEGHIWVIDKGNYRVEEFSSEGEYLGKFGSAGSGNGQFYSPEGIAIDAKGNIWVSNSLLPSRVQKFNPKGELLKILGSTGSGNGQFKQPAGIAVGPDGNVWVADQNNHRVQEFNEAGEYVRQWQGSGTAAFTPFAIDVDPNGTVWVGDTEHNRVEGFGEYGELLAQFGSEGSGSGQFKLSGAIGLQADLSGNILVTDSGNNRVQRWSWPNWRSEITTEITVDGKRVDSGQAGCSSEHCPITREWALESSAYSVGKHTILAKATDGLGNTTTKSLTIEVQRDTTKPTLQAGGELLNAPEGWVEQESYGLNATATDAGYGATSLAFKIDGQQVASSSNPCPEGACEESLSKPIDMSSYSGGAHAAELIATDGVGNSTSQHWTINVDPEGHITATEAEDTLEAADATSESTVVAPINQVLDPEQIEGGDNPGLQLSGSEITSTGVPDTTTMTTDPEEGFTIHSPEGTTTITPIVNESSSAVSIAEGVAGVAANIGNEVDSVIRPEYNGVQTFQAIRSESSPESYSWRLHLAPGQELRYINPTQAEVAYEDGTIAFLMTAENAHDATGHPVPTSLEVNGDVLTLKVEFRSGTFVYPIVSGQGWETSYKVPVVVQGPEDEAQIREREERERAEREAAEGGEGPVPPAPQQPISREVAEWLARAAMGGNANVEAPPYPSGGASASTIRHYVVHEQHVCQVWHCGIWRVWIAGGAESQHPHFTRGFNWSEWVENTELNCGSYYGPAYALIGLEIYEEGCDFAGQWKVWKGEGRHLTIWTRDTIEVPVITDVVQEAFTNHLALLVWIWPNGFQQKVVRHFDPGVEEE